MKKKLQFFIAISILLGMGLSSCNTSKKLMISEAKVDKLKQDSTGLQNKLDNYNDRTQNLEANSVALQDKYF